MSTPIDSDLYWVRYEPGRVLVAVMALSPGAELAHRRLCDLVWANGHWPAADAAAAPAQTRTPRRAWPNVLAELADVGWQVEEERLVNPSVAAVLDQARELHRTRSAAGRAGAQVRWSRPAEAPPGAYPGISHSDGASH
jgi:hypothetical protein